MQTDQQTPHDGAAVTPEASEPPEVTELEPGAHQQALDYVANQGTKESSGQDALEQLLVQHNKVTIFRFMRRYGIQQIIVNYSGGGDEGQTDQIDFDPPDQLDGDELVQQLVEGHDWDREKREKVRRIDLRTMSPEDAAEALCDAALVQAGHSGYHNGDGGEGTLTLTLEGESAVLAHSNFYTASDDSVHTL